MCKQVRNKRKNRTFGAGILWFVMIVSLCLSACVGKTDSASTTQVTTEEISKTTEVTQNTTEPEPTSVPQKEWNNKNVLFRETFEQNDGGSIGNTEAKRAILENVKTENKVQVMNEDGTINMKWLKNTNGSLHFGESYWEDYSVEAEVCFHEDCAQDAPNEFRLLSRARNTQLYGEFYYAAVLINGKQVALRKVYTTSAGQVYTGNAGVVKTVDVESYLQDGKSHILRMDVVDDTVTVYWDGKELINWTDNSPSKNKKGGIGVYTDKTAVYIDNIQVTKLTTGTTVKEEVVNEPDIKQAAPNETKVTYIKSDGLNEGLYNTGNTWHLPGDVAVVSGVGLADIVSVGVDRLSDNRGTKLGYTIHPEAGNLPTEKEAEGASDSAYSPETGVVVELIQSTDSSFKYIIPEEMEEGIYAVRIALESGCVLDYYLNAPVVEWVQGNEGRIATPGGTLRLFGSNLRPEGTEDKVAIALKAADGAVTLLTEVTGDNIYSASVNIPEDMEPGTYDVYLHNGYGDDTAWSSPKTITIGASPRDAWPKEVFNVKDYGAVGDAKTNDTDAIKAALNAVKKNGGGVLYFPKGQYWIDEGGLTIPKRTVMRGDSNKEAMIFFVPFNWDYGELPAYMFKGSTDFAIENITFSGSRIGTFLEAGKPKTQKADKTDWESFITKPGEVKEQDVRTENVYITNCRFYFEAMAGMPTLNNGDANLEAQTLINKELREYQSNILELGGENIQIVGNDFYSTGSAIYSGGKKTYVLISGNTYDGDGWIPYGGMTYSIIEKNSGNSTIGLAGQKIYYADNYIEDRTQNNRELFTTDGGSGGHNGGIVNNGNGTYTLPKAKFTENDKAGAYAVFILSGTGAGQFRVIASNTADTITLESDFYVEPDETSVVSVSEVRDKMFFINSECYNGGDFQYYGTQTNTVMDGTHLVRCGGIRSWARYVYGSYMPNWYDSFVNCKIEDGNFFWYYGADTKTGHSYMKIIGQGSTGLNVGSLVRRCEMSENAHFALEASGEKDSIIDLVMDDNKVTNSEKGVAFYHDAANVTGVFIRRMQFTDVSEEWYHANGNAEDFMKQAGKERILIME